MSSPSPLPAPSALPFHHRVHEATPEELAAHNASRKAWRPRARALPDAESLIGQIASASEATATQIAAWVGHPDERVLLALLRNHQIAPWKGDFGKRLAAFFYDRAMRAAIAAGVEWTPLLDTLAIYGRWPDEGSLRVMYAGEGGGPLPPECEAPYRTEADQVARLAPWVAAQTDPSAFAALRRFKAPALAKLVAREARCLDLETTREFWCQHSARSGSEFAQNQHLTPALVETLTAWSLDLVRRGRDAADSRDPWNGVVYLKGLAERDQLPADVIATLWAIAETPRRATTDPNADALSDESATIRRASDVLLALERTFSEADIVRLLRTRALGETTSLRFLRDPRATPAVYEALLDTAVSQTVRNQIAHDAKAARVPAVRTRLLASISIDIVRALISTADDPVECRWLFGRLLKQDPNRALSHIEAGTGCVRTAIHPHDLFPLTQHRDLEMRLRTMTAITLLTPDPSVTPEPPRRPTGGRAPATRR